jgi:hypothetical protein
MIGNVYFDPSYGIGEYTDQKKYETDAFAGTMEESLVLHAAPVDDGNSSNHADEINSYTPRQASDYIPNTE